MQVKFKHLYTCNLRKSFSQVRQLHINVTQTLNSTYSIIHGKKPQKDTEECSELILSMKYIQEQIIRLHQPTISSVNDSDQQMRLLNCQPYLLNLMYFYLQLQMQNKCSIEKKSLLQLRLSSSSKIVIVSLL